MTFLQRESDWKVSRLPDTLELVILGAIDIKQIQAANNELAAYENAQKSLELYYFKSDAKDCY
ncbi:hypothetical protein ATN88_02215 [Enterovibrio coralii]|uniref:Uncharacterized protein n=1 Tax=Enterovibrio coralii TaxID=294935 RepID=A0A135I812_9GAMM|nr:hypothetical protein ATN88_02215 [Enterovibrio coralii]